MTKTKDIDIFIGRQLREKRAMVELTQTALAGEVGLTFQQLQKYENGVNRVSAGRLYEFSRIIGFSLDEFFLGFERAPNANILLARKKYKRISKDIEPTAQRLAVALQNIAHEDLREKAIQSLHALAKTFSACDSLIIPPSERAADDV